MAATRAALVGGPANHTLRHIYPGPSFPSVATFDPSLAAARRIGWAASTAGTPVPFRCLQTPMCGEGGR